MLKTDLLTLAIQTRKTVSFIYDNKTRIVEVHAIGRTNKGSDVMRGFQVAGEASSPLPRWGLFTLDKMDALTLLAFPDSEAPRPGYARDDKQMVEIYAQL